MEWNKIEDKKPRNSQLIVVRMKATSQVITARYYIKEGGVAMLSLPSGKCSESKVDVWLELPAFP